MSVFLEVVVLGGVGILNCQGRVVEEVEGEGIERLQFDGAFSFQ